jgi:hypothetical protein
MTALLAICLVVLAAILLAAYAIAQKSGLEITGGSGFFWFRLSVPGKDDKPANRELDPSNGSPVGDEQAGGPGIAGHPGPHPG